jgi:hypothetical protein
MGGNGNRRASCSSPNTRCVLSASGRGRFERRRWWTISCRTAEIVADSGTWAISKGYAGGITAKKRGEDCEREDRGHADISSGEVS